MGEAKRRQDRVTRYNKVFDAAERKVEELQPGDIERAQKENAEAARIKRSEAAKKAAATRKANKGA